MIKQIAYLLIALGVGWGAGEIHGYFRGWNAHSEKVNKDYQERQARAQVQQAKDVVRSATADVAGAKENDVIVREVIKYVSTPGRDKCDFDAERVRIKQRAVTNANHIEGYDDPALPVR